MLKVLIIDDTRSVHAFIKSILKNFAIEFTSVSDGSEAVELLKTDPKLDVIFLDWEMPKLNGPQTFDEIKRLGVQTPVIMMTTKNQPSDIMQMLTAGVAEYIMKPFTVDIFVEKTESVLGRKISHAA